MARTKDLTTDRTSRPKSGGKIGGPLAQQSPVLNEQEIGMNFHSVHPIDTLLVSQLETILNGEKALRARYSSLDAGSNNCETRRALSNELSILRDQADRLYRLMSAMDSFGSTHAELSAALA